MLQEERENRKGEEGGGEIKALGLGFPPQLLFIRLPIMLGPGVSMVVELNLTLRIRPMAF